MSEINIEPITLETANLIINSAIKKAREIKINPIMVVVLDHRGAIKACSGEDGISSLRFKIAHGKANGAFQMGMGSRALFNRAEQQAAQQQNFVDAAAAKRDIKQYTGGNGSNQFDGASSRAEYDRDPTGYSGSF